MSKLKYQICPYEYQLKTKRLLHTVIEKRNFLKNKKNYIGNTYESVLDDLATELRNDIYDKYQNSYFVCGISNAAENLPNKKNIAHEHIYPRTNYSAKQLLTMPENIFNKMTIDDLWNLVYYKYGKVIEITKNEHAKIKKGWERNNIKVDFKSKKFNSIDKNHMKIYLEYIKSLNISPIKFINEYAYLNNN